MTFFGILNVRHHCTEHDALLKKLPGEVAKNKIMLWQVD